MLPLLSIGCFLLIKCSMFVLILIFVIFWNHDRFFLGLWQSSLHSSFIKCHVSIDNHFLCLWTVKRVGLWVCIIAHKDAYLAFIIKFLLELMWYISMCNTSKYSKVPNWGSLLVDSLCRTLVQNINCSSNFLCPKFLMNFFCFQHASHYVHNCYVLYFSYSILLKCVSCC